MRFFIFFVFSIISFSVFSQWSTDPANPLVICEAAGHQESVQTLDDGDGGWYVFWRDQRADAGANGDYGIYAQRVNNEGFVQWTPNGLPLTNHPGHNIVDYSVDMLDNGKMMMVYMMSNSNSVDSILVQLIDSDGNLEWADGVVIGELDEAQIGFSVVDMLAVGNSALISYYRTVVGGQKRTFVDRVEQDGTTLYGLSGSHIPTNNFGPMGLVTDNNGGAIIHWRNSNGSGTHLSALRINDQCVSQWAGIVDPIAGSDGLNWAFHNIEDGLGGIAFVYRSLSKIRYTRLDGTGANVTTPQIQQMGDFESSQDNPRILKVDDFFYVLWEDNRPPANNQDLYMQKIDLNGDPQWAPEGVMAIQGQTYIPHGKMVETDSSGVIVAQLQASAGLAAQRIREDGTAAWESLGFFVDTSNDPFYDDFTMHSDGHGGAVAFWRSFDNDEIYANQITFYGNTGALSVVDHSDISFHVWPNPTSDFVNIKLNNYSGQIGLSLLDVTGKVCLKRMLNYSGEQLPLDISELVRGVYILSLEIDNYKVSKRLVII